MHRSAKPVCDGAHPSWASYMNYGKEDQLCIIRIGEAEQICCSAFGVPGCQPSSPNGR